MENGLYVDILRLKEHISKIRQEWYAAQRLCENLRLARQCAEPGDAWRYDELIAQADNLAGYFRTMSETVENMTIELEQLSLKAGRMLEDAEAYVLFPQWEL